jgi:hypothetical protein
MESSAQQDTQDLLAYVVEFLQFHDFSSTVQVFLFISCLDMINYSFEGALPPAVAWSIAYWAERKKATMSGTAQWSLCLQHALDTKAGISVLSTSDNTGNCRLHSALKQATIRCDHCRPSVGCQCPRQTQNKSCQVILRVQAFNAERESKRLLLHESLGSVPMAGKARSTVVADMVRSWRFLTPNAVSLVYMQEDAYCHEGHLARRSCCKCD